MLRDDQEREVTPGLRASPTLSVNGFISGSKTCGISLTILWYSFNISINLEKKEMVVLKE